MTTVREIEAKTLLSSSKRPDPWFGLKYTMNLYRDKDQREIDLLLVQDGVAYPLEIKKTAAPGKDDVRHFQALERLGLSIGPGGVICLAQQSLPLTASTQSIPVWAI